MNETRVLAEQSAALRYEDLPKDVVAKVKYLILDQLGCQVGFATLPVSKGVYRYTLDRAASGQSTVAYYGTKVSAIDAAFCNAVFGHGFELDDIDIRTASHPGVAVIPVALALAERYAKSGKETITAVVAGYEAFLRFGYAAVRMMDRYFDTTAVSGAFGAAAAACQMMGLSEAITQHAMAIATTEASSNSEYIKTGGSVKRTWGALGAYAGMRSAMLAKHGLTGPTEAIEGAMGYLKSLCEDDYDASWLTLPFGDRFLILDVGHKPYSCCAGQHTVIDATEKIRAQGVRIEDVAAVDILQLKHDVQNCGGMADPHNVVEAQFCGRFACAVRLAKGANGAAEYTQESVDDPEIKRVVNLATYRADYDRRYLTEGSAPARVTVTTKDGKVYQETVFYAKGLPENPLTHEEAVAKFKHQVRFAIPEGAADKIVDYVMRFDELDDVTPLMSLICA